MPSESSISPWRERTLMVAAALLVVVVAVFSFLTWRNTTEQTRRLGVERQMVRRSAELLIALDDAETGQRGYLLTGRDYYLNIYREALNQVPISLGALARLAPGPQDDAARLVEELRPLVAEKLGELQETVDVGRSQGAEAARAITLSDRGKRAMDRVRAVERELEDLSTGRQRAAAAEVESSTNRQGWIATLGCGALFGLLLLAALEIHRATESRLKLIGELREQGEKTRQARDWLQTTLTSIGDAVIATDPVGQVTFLNPTAQHLTGWTQEEAVGHPIDELFQITNEVTGAPVDSPIGRVLREGTVVGLANGTNLARRGGAAIPIDDTAAPICDAQGKIVGAVLVFRDISAKRAAEANEREAALTAARLAAIVESSHDAIVAKDLNGIVRSWNRGAEALFGYSAEEMLGRPIQVLNPNPEPDAMNGILDRIRRGERIEHFETTRRTKTGQIVSIDLTISPIRDRNGEIIGASKIARDITGRVAAERSLASQASALARANAELQQFSYAASHDLREPLRTVATFSQLLQRSANDRLTDKERDYSTRVIAGTQRMGEMVTALLEYSRYGGTEAAEISELETNQVLATVLISLSGAIVEGKAQVTTDPLPVIWADGMAFSRVLQNLISNAIKYRGAEPPRIHISAESMQEDGKSYWRFTVADNGLGIDPAYQQQIFRLFLRLHGQEYPGVGIGLASCKKIVESGGGRIWVESTLGQGSSFHFTVPREEPSPRVL